MSQKGIQKQNNIPGQRKIRLRIRRRPNKKVEKPPPKRQFKIRIKANGLEKTCLTSIPEDSADDVDSDSDEDFEPVPTWTVNRSGGKTLRYGEQNLRKRSRSSSLERQEVSSTGRVKRKKRNMEGKLVLEAYGWELEICSIVGHQQKKKRVLEIIKTGLQGGFVTGMANAAQKDGFVASLSDPSGEIRAGGIFHLEHCGKSLSYCCLSIFATEPSYQKMGLGRMLTAYIIHRSLQNHFKIVVSARPEAVPFWCHSTMGFRRMSVEELRKYNRPVPGKKKKKRDELVDLIYDGPTSDLISLSLLRFRPTDPLPNTRSKRGGPR